VKLGRNLLTGLTAAIIASGATMSLAYTAWTQQLTLTNVVSTGSLAAIWNNFPVSCQDNQGSGPIYATVTAFRDQTDYTLAHMAISQGYPGYQAACSLTWSNTGTIGIVLQSLDVNGTTVQSGVPTNFDLNGDGVADVQIVYYAGTGGSYASGMGGSQTLQINVLDAPPNASLAFNAHANFVQRGPGA